jgi:hypothetical protein
MMMRGAHENTIEVDELCDSVLGFDPRQLLSIYFPPQLDEMIQS